MITIEMGLEKTKLLTSHFKYVQEIGERIGFISVKKILLSHSSHILRTHHLKRLHSPTNRNIVD